MAETIPNSHPLLKPPRKSVLWAIALCLLLFTVVPGGFFLWFAFSQHLAIGGRLLFLAIAALAFALPIRLAFVSVRRRVTTGSWMVSDEERLRNRARFLARETPQRTRRMKAIGWFSDVIPLLLAVEFIWLMFRPHRPPLDWSDYLMLAVCPLLIAQSVWSITKKLRSSPPSGSAADSPPPDILPS